MSHHQAFERAFTKELAIRQRKLTEAKHEWIMKAHEKAIARLVLQRVCDHMFNPVATINGRAYRVLQCRKCKFRYIE